MNIFNNLPNPQREKWEQHQKYLRDRGITENEFQQELKLKREQEHQDYLNSLGITEEIFQKREKRKLLKEKIIENLTSGLGCLFLLSLFVGLPILAVSDEGKPILIIIGIIWGIFLFGSIIVSLVFLTNEAIKDSISNNILRIVIAILISILVIGGIAYTCGNSNTEYHFDDAHRPDRF